MSESVWPVRCGWCGTVFYSPVRYVNRAEKLGARMFCSRECTGLARRDPNPPTDAEKRAAKAEYDRRRRAELGEELLAEKRAAYHAAVATNPELIRTKERELRKKNMPRHVEYCRRPEYKKWKKSYDRQYRAEKDFGPFAEAAILLNDLETEIYSRASRYEIYTTNGTLNKKQNRRRDYERQADRR